MTPNSFAVSVLLHKDGDAWVAQCLEYDLAAQAPTLEDAKKRFLGTLGAQIMMDLRAKRTPLAQLGMAPQRYFEKMVRAEQDGPQLPVYVPAAVGTPRVHASFLLDKAA